LTRRTEKWATSENDYGSKVSVLTKMKVDKHRLHRESNLRSKGAGVACVWGGGGGGIGKSPVIL